jgi:pimeloyl-ACP methyl ester carboxylesterase
MNRRFDLVAIDCDGSRLHGLWCAQEKAKGTAVHVHGTWGNFYGNPFIVPIARLYSDLSINYLTANFPGHDETAIGERFDDFTKALDSWLDRYGAGEPILLQGHSLGALKILRYMKDNRAMNRHRVRCLVLLSPFDVVAFYSCGNLDRNEERLQRIRDLIEIHGAGAPVPKDVFDMWSISLATFLELASSGTVSDQFPSRLGLEGTALDKIELPKFVAIGSEDFAAYPSPSQVHQMTNRLHSVHSVLVEGAPHNFEGKVDSLVSALKVWAEPIWNR